MDKKTKEPDVDLALFYFELIKYGKGKANFREGAWFAHMFFKTYDSCENLIHS